MDRIYRWSLVQKGQCHKVLGSRVIKHDKWKFYPRKFLPSNFLHNEILSKPWNFLPRKFPRLPCTHVKCCVTWNTTSIHTYMHNLQLTQVNYIFKLCFLQFPDELQLGQKWCSKSSLLFCLLNWFVVSDEVLGLRDGGMAILTAFTSRVPFNLTVQIVDIVWPVVWSVKKLC